jgi:predicted TIM-barrel enzyme
LATPLKKVAEFKQTLGDFPVIVGAGVTIDTLPDTIRQSEGVIVGSWLKDNHRDYGFVNEKNVELFMAAAGTNR